MVKSRLIDALKTGRTVSFLYADKIRVVEVHAVGDSTAGKLVMRGYQVGGHASRPLPQWTLFEVDKIEHIGFGKEKSKAPRPGYKKGDSQMTKIYAQIDQ